MATTKTVQVAGYVAVNDIGCPAWGFGATAMEAISDAVRVSGVDACGLTGDDLDQFEDSLRALPASAAALDSIKADPEMRGVRWLREEEIFVTRDEDLAMRYGAEVDA